ncbi:MAG: hypothetical protein JXO22_14145 [Phycisphaerae bacterium]|nr:hypothetical protein [Phycisphaerae bacterium]
MILARRSWIGRDVECPHCQASMSVPEPDPSGAPTRAARPSLAARRFFNFPCPRCDSLLEGHTGMSGRVGSCPTCGVRFAVPFFNPRTNRPSRAQLLDDEQEAPAPVHAYGSCGSEAPRIVRDDDGTSMIVCPRCEEYNDIDADHCAACGVPFSMEGAPTGASQQSEGLATAALILGILSLPAFVVVVPGLVAVALGIMSRMRATQTRKPITGVIGALLGALSLAGAAAFFLL